MLKDLIPIDENYIESGLPPSDTLNYSIDELALALQSKFRQVDLLKFKFLNSNIPAKERLNELLKFKAIMLIPTLRASLGLEQDYLQVEVGFGLLRVINELENSIRSMIAYEDAEHIDFSSPKILASYKMLFELIIDVISENINDNILLSKIIEKVAIRSVGMEAEFNKTFKSLSSALAHTIDNPLTAKFNKRNTDIETIGQNLIETIDRATPFFSKLSKEFETIKNKVIDEIKLSKGETLTQPQQEISPTEQQDNNDNELIDEEF